jgi:hypothetical protein
MTDYYYYPLIAKAVNGLDESTPQARRSVYNRARTALLTKLGGVEPPLAEAECQSAPKFDPPYCLT